MSLEELNLLCVMFWMNHCIILIGTVVAWWLAGEDGSAVVRNRCPEWECRFRPYSRDIANILLKTNKGRGQGRQRQEA